MEARATRRRIRRALGDFLSTEVAGGVVLLTAVAFALAWANLSSSSYERFWEASAELPLGPLRSPHELRGWITEGLMTIFFFVVGLEIKRELLAGELRGWRRSSLPVIAAIGGMVLPAVLYLAFNTSGTEARGWGIPMATDIAFALGVLTVLGDRIPQQMKMLLLAIAIADDVGAVIVIAIFYSGDLDVGFLGAAFAALAAVAVLARLRIPGPVAVRRTLFGIGSVAVWLCVLNSGIHGTMAGVMVAATIPLGAAPTIPSAEDLEALLHRGSSFVVLPLFALANAGVILADTSVSALGSGIGMGIIVGLVVGKPLGIWLFAVGALRLRLARLPSGISPSHVLAIGSLAGVGFTVSLFVSGLAFADPGQAEQAQLAILVASTAAAVLGALACIFATRPRGDFLSDPDTRVG